MYVGDNFLIISKNKNKDIDNEMLIHALSLFENKNNFNLYLILNEHYSELFLDRLVKGIFYIIQCMEYTGSTQNNLYVYTSCKELIAKIDYFKETFGKYADRLILKGFNDLINQSFVDENYYINDDYFNKIFQITDDLIQVIVPKLSNVKIRI